MASGGTPSAPGGATESERPASALPSTQARVLAFLAILAAGVCGGLIGYSFVKLQCTGNCGTPTGLGAFFGAIIAAVGVAVVAVLTLRAMGEWKTIKEARAKEAEQYLEDEGLGAATREPPELLEGRSDSQLKPPPSNGYDQN